MANLTGDILTKLEGATFIEILHHIRIWYHKI